MSSSLTVCNSSEPLLGWTLTYGGKWVLYDNWQQPAQWLDQEEAPKHFPKPNLHQKRSWSPFSGLLLVWSTTAFWILMKPLHLRSMLSKSMKWSEMKWKSLSSVQLCNPKDCSLPGSPVHGILEARILEWVAIPFSRVSSWPRDQTRVSCITGRFFTVWTTREAPNTGRHQKEHPQPGFSLEWFH